MRTIYQRIMIPFVIILILLPISIFLLFNITIHFYARIDAERDLQSTLSTVHTLIEAQNTKADEERNKVLQSLSAGLTASQLTGNVQFFILDQNNRILYPLNQASSILDADFQSYLQQNPVPADGKIVRRKLSGTTYYLAAETLDYYNGNYNLTLLFISIGSIAQPLIKSINIALVAIICFTTIISIFVAYRVARSISKPIVLASDNAARIGEGTFSQMPVETHTRELNEFCNSINDMAQRLAAYDHAQKAFLQNASHELRTPLMSIQGYAEGIENGVLQDSRQAAGIIRRESVRLNTLVDELLTLSRIENQTYHGTMTPYNLSNLILDAVQRINGLALKEQIRLQTDLQPEVNASVDEALFSQAVINILSNCIRYAKSEIQIQTRLEDGRAVVQIEDDGRGFSEEDLAHGFDRFYKGKGGNFGLGLSIAKSAVEYMNGEIKLYNGESGAAFRLSFPLVPSERQA